MRALNRVAEYESYKDAPKPDPRTPSMDKKLPIYSNGGSKFKLTCVNCNKIGHCIEWCKSTNVPCMVGQATKMEIEGQRKININSQLDSLEIQLEGNG